jgi:hypothetical protein
MENIRSSFPRSRCAPAFIGGSLPILFAAIASVSAQASEPFLIVSDIDDTVKLTHVEKAVRAGANGVFANDTFLGMATLYQEMAKAGLPSSSKAKQGTVTYLSASPRALRGKLRRNLVKWAGFPDGEIILRDYFTQHDIPKYKLEALAKLANQESRPFILVGDDTEHDPELFLEFSGSQSASKTTAIYIRRNNHRVLPEGVTPFFTPLEVGMAEVESGRLSVEALVRVGESMLSELKKDREDALEVLFPSFSYCPEKEYRRLPIGPVASTNGRLVSVIQKVAKEVVRYCYERSL